MTELRMGDMGQRYEVWADDGYGSEILVGWADDPENFLRAIKLHPVWCKPRVIDRLGSTETTRAKVGD